jgi:hypothetical protein
MPQTPTKRRGGFTDEWKKGGKRGTKEEGTVEDHGTEDLGHRQPPPVTSLLSNSFPLPSATTKQNISNNQNNNNSNRHRDRLHDDH